MRRRIEGRIGSSFFKKRKEVIRKK